MPAIPAFTTPRVAQQLRRLGAAILLSGLVASGSAAEQLRNEPSAFLRTSAGGPVDWQKWDAATLQRARTEGRPVYVFIGSFLSELSRATCRQTFANADTAAFLNKNFLCVMVDREEQPDVAALVQDYLVYVKQVTTWPAHVWLTPDLQPFEGSGYLPPTEEWGKTSFMKFAAQVLNAWATGQSGCRTRASEALATLTAPPPPAPAWAADKTKARLTAAADGWRATFDTVHGGFGDPPKHPEPELLRFLLRGSPEDRAAALATLRALAGSTLRDPLDGGFFRYSADAAWHLPNQQKTLAEQARVAMAFMDAAQGDDAAAFTAAARGALDYALNRLARPDGTFAAAEDATAEEFAGYYAWTAAEIDAALGQDAAAFKSAHGVLPAGNVSADDDLSGRLKGKNLLQASVIPDTVPTAAARLLAVRLQRPAPPLDERATAGAHGLLLAALAQAGTQPDGARYLAAATRTYEAVKKQFVLSAEGDLRRLAGTGSPAAPQDYAALALGCRAFARSARVPDADKLATLLLDRVGKLFYDGKTGRYFATPAALPPGFFVRPPAAGDGPSAEALAILAGAPRDQAQGMAAVLSASLEESAVPAPGDTLLALTVFPSN